jgi:hypothetical protein
MAFEARSPVKSTVTLSGNVLSVANFLTRREHCVCWTASSRSGPSKRAQDIDGEFLEALLARVHGPAREATITSLLSSEVSLSGTAFKAFFLPRLCSPSPDVRQHGVSRFSSIPSKLIVCSRSPRACPIEMERRCAVRVTAPSSPCSTGSGSVSGRSRGFV